MQIIILAKRHTRVLCSFVPGFSNLWIKNSFVALELSDLLWNTSVALDLEKIFGETLSLFIYLPMVFLFRKLNTPSKEWIWIHPGIRHLAPLPILEPSSLPPVCRVHQVVPRMLWFSAMSRQIDRSTLVGTPREHYVKQAQWFEHLESVLPPIGTLTPMARRWFALVWPLRCCHSPL